MQRTILIGFAITLLTGGVVTVLAVAEGGAAAEDAERDEIRRQALAYMEAYERIELTAEQERVRQEALGNVPAACCGDFPMADCCCECNLSRTIWGLSKILIAEEGRNAEEVRKAALDWVRRINPDGWSGQACYTGGCGRPFHQDGCGGMQAERLIS